VSEVAAPSAIGPIPVTDRATRTPSFEELDDCEAGAEERKRRSRRR
jgi:hypothetical protein